jgi:hypothetical protein
MSLLSAPWRRAAVAVVAGTEAFSLSVFVFPDEAWLWGLGVGLAAALFLLVAPALSLAARWRYLRLRDVLVPVVVFVLTVVQKPQLLGQNGLRLAFALLLFGGLGAAVRMFIGTRGAGPDAPPPQS